MKNLFFIECIKLRFVKNKLSIMYEGCLEEITIIIKKDKRIKELREESNLTIDEVCFALDMSRSEYKNCENGVGEATVEFIYNLAEYYNILMDYIVERSDFRNTK